jgi:hypothetical protein
MNMRSSLSTGMMDDKSIDFAFENGIEQHGRSAKTITAGADFILEMFLQTLW